MFILCVQVTDHECEEGALAHVGAHRDDGVALGIYEVTLEQALVSLLNNLTANVEGRQG